MQPILAIAALAVGAGLLSTGFLAGNNEFEIWVQELGFAQEVIEAPIDHANIDFTVEKTRDTKGTTSQYDDVWKNEITKCSFHTFDTLEDGSEVICKLQSWPRNADGTMDTSSTERVTVCEGRYAFGVVSPANPIGDSWAASTTIYVPIDLTMTAYPGACDVMNIDGVKIVASGKEPLSAFCDTTTHDLNEADGDLMYEPWGEDGVNDEGFNDDETCTLKLS